MLAYPVELKEDSGVIVVTVPDIPGVMTYGKDAGDACSHAMDALETAIWFLMKERLEVPLPSAPRWGQRTVMLGTLIELKVTLYRTMRERHVTKADLARMMGLQPSQVDRLLGRSHASRIELFDRAFGVLGKAVSIALNDEYEAAKGYGPSSARVAEPRASYRPGNASATRR
jgi:antitoxin HicB